MKKFVFTCLLALPLTAVSQQEASAWCNFKFGAGVNLSFSSGGCKNLLWGLYQTSDGSGGYPGCGGYGGFPGGYSAQGGAMSYDTTQAAQANQQAPAPAQMNPVQYQQPYYPNSGYTPVGYYYQGQNYQYYQAPAYWYGR